MILLMTVNPGFGGQSYIPQMTGKIRKLREQLNRDGRNIDIQIDGGIGTDNIKEVTSAGANIIVTGSAFFNAPDPALFIKQLRDLAAFASQGEK